MSGLLGDLVERRGEAHEVAVGDIISGGHRVGDKWEIIAMSHGAVGEQIPFDRTLWWRARNLKTGKEATIPPRYIGAKVTFMVTPEVAEAKQMPDRDPVHPVDSVELGLLVAKLGATEIATRDNETGVITAPFVYHLGDWGLHRALHLELAHGVNLDGLSAHGLGYTELLGKYEELRQEHGIFKGYEEAKRLYSDVDLTRTQDEILRWHGYAHDPHHPTFGKQGFPHVHVSTP